MALCYAEKYKYQCKENKRDGRLIRLRLRGIHRPWQCSVESTVLWFNVKCPQPWDSCGFLRIHDLSRRKTLLRFTIKFICAYGYSSSSLLPGFQRCGSPLPSTLVVLDRPIPIAKAENGIQGKPFLRFPSCWLCMVFGHSGEVSL